MAKRNEDQHAGMYKIVLSQYYETREYETSGWLRMQFRYWKWRRLVRKSGNGQVAVYRPRMVEETTTFVKTHDEAWKEYCARIRHDNIVNLRHNGYLNEKGGWYITTHVPAWKMVKWHVERVLPHTEIIDTHKPLLP